MNTLRFRFPLMLIFACSPLFSQKLIVKQFGAPDSVHSFSPNTIVGQSIAHNAVVSTAAVAKEETAGFIIQFSTPSLSEIKKREKQPAINGIAEHQATIAQITSAVRDVTIRREYSEVFNGAAVTMRRSEIERIRKLSGVKNIFEDKKAVAFGTRVISSFAAPDAARSFISSSSTKGGKVRIGILDTGIDYNHEALGRGFGPGFKVIGGYDFVNNDSDPLDDNGHGTHVAGIIAGNSSTLHGIDPNAELLAYKVLDQNGEGYTSTIIAGIEQAVKDSVAVINLSLGTPEGDPDDPLSLAVDHAVEAGVVVVAAAGNGGDYQSIASPGCAREALTVGAIDEQNSIASFSSKGPSNRIYGVKPNIVAPGVNILSAKAGGGYITMSGTSMAAPYIAGLVADMRSRHPEWNAEEIRDAICEGSVDLRLPFFAQGNGKADSSHAFGKTTIITPSSVSFGFDPAVGSQWSATDTLVISNSADTILQYSFQQISSTSGINVRCEPNDVTLSPFSRAEILVRAEINNGTTANNTSLQDGYSGKIIAFSSDDTIQIPFVVFKGPVLQLSFSETPMQVLIHNRSDRSYYYAPQSNFLSAILPSGDYDIVTAFYPSTFVVRENVQTDSTLTLAISKSEAVNRVIILPSDENNAPLGMKDSHSTFSYLEALMYNAGGISQVFMSGGPLTTSFAKQEIDFSPVSSNYSFGCSLDLQYGTSTSYTFDVVLDSGITTSTTFAFSASDLKKIEFNYEIDTSVTRAFPVEWSVFAQQQNVIGTTYYDGTAAPLTFPFTQIGYYSRRSSTHFPIFHLREAYKY
ncbi:MAG: S8 family serine peptidase [Bacteroidota bacterium]|nr:S8 family serine peptidase [Bacteroidota bacterium]